MGQRDRLIVPALFIYLLLQYECDRKLGQGTCPSVPARPPVPESYESNFFHMILELDMSRGLGGFSQYFINQFF
jgi:hypothetical protein